MITGIQHLRNDSLFINVRNFKANAVKRFILDRAALSFSVALGRIGLELVGYVMRLDEVFHKVRVIVGADMKYAVDRTDDPRFI